MAPVEWHIIDPPTTTYSINLYSVSSLGSILARGVFDMPIPQYHHPLCPRRDQSNLPSPLHMIESQVPVTLHWSPALSCWTFPQPCSRLWCPSGLWSIILLWILWISHLTHLSSPHQSNTFSTLNPVTVLMKLTGMQRTLIVLACMHKLMIPIIHCIILYISNVHPIATHCNIRGVRGWMTTSELDLCLVLHYES